MELVIEPQPVKVENLDPIPVALAEHTDSPAQEVAREVMAKAGVDARVLQTEAQRKTSDMWERTQKNIALSVVWATLFVAVVKSLEAVIVQSSDPTEAGVAFVFLASVANLVIGFYFGRTNHQKVGGPGGESEPEPR